MACFRKYWIAEALTVLGILAAVFPLSMTVTSAKWVGQKDLEVRFSVEDAMSGSPIPNAEIRIHDEGRDLCHDREPSSFVLVCDINGRTTHITKGCMCFGSSSWFENTFRSHLPCWRYSSCARGYKQSEELVLDNRENFMKVTRGEATAKLEVNVLLNKDSD